MEKVAIEFNGSLVVRSSGGSGACLPCPALAFALVLLLALSLTSKCSSRVV